MLDSVADEFDRNSPQACETVLVGILPDLAVRTACLRLLLDGIDAAHRLSPASWSVTLFRNGFRLNVGSAEAYRLREGPVRLPPVRLLLEPGVGLDSALSPFLRPTPYRSVPPETQLFEASPLELVGLLSHVRGPFLSFVRGASVTKRGKPRRTPYYPSFSPGMISYLSAFLGTPVPTPQYGSAGSRAGA